MSSNLDEIYRRYSPIVLRRCRQLLGDEGRARDAMHDVFVQLLAKPRELRPHGLSSLLFCIATRICCNRLRSASRRPEDSRDALLFEIVDAGGDLEAQQAARDLLARLFGREPVSSQTIAVLHLVDGMTLNEVAVAVGLSVSGVRKRLRRMQARLSTIAETSAPGVHL
ncbi:MAG: RNA polymerase sigma factor [Nannocystaceae bacterium]